MKSIPCTVIASIIGAVVVGTLWHGVLRRLPWWAQAIIALLLLCGLLAWACCAIAGRVDEAQHCGDQAWRGETPPVLGEDVPVVWK